MNAAALGSALFVTAVVAVPALVAIPWGAGAQAGGRAGARGDQGPIQTLRRRLAEEYGLDSGTGSAQWRYWHNIQCLRVVAALAIMLIHMEPALRAVGAGGPGREILRFGTDLFLVLAGFLTAQIVARSNKSGIDYLRDRAIRLLPLYVLFTCLAFLAKRHLMQSEEETVSHLLMSITFVPYDQFPVLHPAWSLYLIVEFSVFVAVAMHLHPRRAMAVAAGLTLVAVALGRLGDAKAPVVLMYGNPMLFDFLLGALIYAMVSGQRLDWAGPQATKGVAATLIAVGGTLIVLRPFLWLDLVRPIALGIPAALLVLGFTLLERSGNFRPSRTINFVAKCTFSIYLCHWFVAAASDKIIEMGDDAPIYGLIMLATAPAMVLYTSILVYVFIEAPMTRRLRRANPTRASRTG